MTTVLVDSFRFLPRSFAPMYASAAPIDGESEPVWATFEPRLAAAVPFYGPLPDDADFGDSKAAVLALYGALDQRVNATRDAAKTALDRAGLTSEFVTYQGANHAFFNDTGDRFDPEAAEEAWSDTLDWFKEYL